MAVGQLADTSIAALGARHKLVPGVDVLAVERGHGQGRRLAGFKLHKRLIPAAQRRSPVQRGINQVRVKATRVRQKRLF